MEKTAEVPAEPGAKIHCAQCRQIFPMRVSPENRILPCPFCNHPPNAEFQAMVVRLGHLLAGLAGRAMGILLGTGAVALGLAIIATPIWLAIVATRWLIGN